MAAVSDERIDFLALALARLEIAKQLKKKNAEITIKSVRHRQTNQKMKSNATEWMALIFEFQ